MRKAALRSPDGLRPLAEVRPPAFDQMSAPGLCFSRLTLEP